MIAAIIAVLVLASGGEGQTANNYRITITGGTTESFSNTGFGIEQQSGTTSQSYSYISGFTRTINEFRIYTNEISLFPGAFTISPYIASLFILVDGEVSYIEATDVPQQVQDLIKRSYPDAETSDRAFIASYDFNVSGQPDQSNSYQIVFACNNGGVTCYALVLYFQTEITVEGEAIIQQYSPYTEITIVEDPTNGDSESNVGINGVFLFRLSDTLESASPPPPPPPSCPEVGTEGCNELMKNIFCIAMRRKDPTAPVPAPCDNDIVNMHV